MILRIGLGIGVEYVNNNILDLGITNPMMNNALRSYNDFGLE